MSTEAAQTREERHAALRVYTLERRQQRHDHVAATITAALAERASLARDLAEAVDGAIAIAHDRGIAVRDLATETADARAEAAALAAGRQAKIDNVALEFPVLSHQFADDGPVLALGTSPALVAPVAAYFGMFPVLYNVFVTRAHTEVVQPNTAHRFHIDPEDTISMKVFVHLTDVVSDCGPLHVLPARLSRHVLETVDYRGIDYLDDAQVDELVGWAHVVEVTGSPGTIAFADTTRCLHFGGRPRAAGKPVREMLVYQYLLPTSTLMAGSEGSPARRFLPQLRANGDLQWDALLGDALPGWPAGTLGTGVS